MSLGYGKGTAEKLLEEAGDELNQLRMGPLSSHIRIGLKKASINDTIKNVKTENYTDSIQSTLKNDGVPVIADIATVMPSDERFLEGPVAVIECFQQIPCNPCVKACKCGAITIPGDINGLPVVDAKQCNGCGICISLCPGLAIFVVDKTYDEKHALIKLPYEYVPVPEAKQYVTGLNRAGEKLGSFAVEKVVSGGSKNKTHTISIIVPKELAMEVRDIKVEESDDE